MSTSPGRPQRADQHKVILHGHIILPTKHIADGTWEETPSGRHRLKTSVQRSSFSSSFVM